MTATTAPPTGRTAPSLVEALSLRRVLRIGVLSGLVMAYVAAIGMLQTFNGRMLVDPILSLGYMVLFGVVALGGASFSRREEIEGIEPEPRTGMDLIKAAASGLIAGLILVLFALIVETFPDMRSVFPRLGPPMVDAATLGVGTGAGFVVLPVVSAVVAAAAAAFAWIPDRIRRALLIAMGTVLAVSLFEALIDDMFDLLPAIPDFLYARATGLTLVSALVVLAITIALVLYLPGKGPSLKRRLGPEAEPATRRRTTITLAVIAFLALIVLPQLLGGIMNELLTNVGFFAIMALGLNVVLGYAGLLDLGYVAFFAVGAYTAGVLTSPLSPTWNPELGFWLAFPVVLVMGTIAGILVGTPVLRMRGDYLAIVTLGFGEIVRLTLLSDWLSPYFGGAQGVRNIPGVPVLGLEVNATTPHLMIYLVLFFVFLAVFVSWRVEDSRIGRAWAALREDEDVAEAVGVDTVKAKLLAFITGAVLASFAGALFAAKVGSVFATSFQILISIVILVIVIVGGMGSIPGVIAGGLVLIGVLGGPKQPGLLQEFGEFKLLIYGALLVYMMLKRPEGLIPSTRRQQELHQEEFLQDAWLDKGAPPEAEGGRA